MEIPDFFLVAENSGIRIFRFPLPETGSVSMPTAAGDVIGLDSSGTMTRGEEQAHLGHECGHCMCGGFYNRYSLFDLVERHEVRADRWYIKHAIPRLVLKQLLRQGYDAWEIAELLNTTEEYVRQAYYYYKEME